MSLPAPAETSYQTAQPGTRRAARLMQALGPSASAVWAELSPGEADQLSAAMESQRSEPNLVATPPETGAFLKAFRQPAGPMADRSRDLWRRLGELEPAITARFIEHEHPQLVILSRLEPETVAHVVRLLPRQMASIALRRLMHLSRVRGPALEVVESAMEELLASRSGQQAGDGVESVARIFDRLDPRLEQGFMSSLDQNEPGSASRIRALMFTFDDLSALDPGAIQTILSSVDRAVLALALKGAKTPVRQVFLKNMTKRAGELLVSEIEALGPVRRSEITAARQEITGIARGLARRGDILAAGQEEDELIE